MVILGPPLAGMDSTSPWLGAVTTPHPGAGVRAATLSPKLWETSYILEYDTSIFNMAQKYSRYIAPMRATSQL